MNIIESKLKGVFFIKPKVFTDHRGKFFQVLTKDEADSFGIDLTIFQYQYSVSKKGVIRGMHFQLPPFDQNKFVTCVHGKVLDVVIDLRKNSLTYKQFDSFELDANTGGAVFIPKGFAHGFQALTEDATIMYQVSAPWMPSHDRGIHALKFGFNWPLLEQAILSDKDKAHPSLDEFESPWN
jgi:dTDP-4-dehydrorhamnose 3,5-epimerase